MQNPQYPTIAIAVFLVIFAACIIILAWPISEPWHKNCCVIVAVVLVAIAATLILFVYLTNPIIPPPVPPVQPVIKITSHIENKETMAQTVRGVASRIPEGSQIWLVLYAHDPTNRYYPQQAINPDRNGDWFLPGITIGNRNNVGYKFDIIVLLADEHAKKKFNDYFHYSNLAKSGWPGMEQLPDGAEVYDNVTVTRTSSP